MIYVFIVEMQMWNGWSLSVKNTVTDWLLEAVINGFLRLVTDFVHARDDNVKNYTNKRGGGSWKKPPTGHTSEGWRRRRRKMKGKGEN